MYIVFIFFFIILIFSFILFFLFFFFNDTATIEIYTLSLHDALPISCGSPAKKRRRWVVLRRAAVLPAGNCRWCGWSGHREPGGLRGGPRRAAGRLQHGGDPGGDAAHPLLRPAPGGYRHSSADSRHLPVLRRDRGRP